MITDTLRAVCASALPRPHRRAHGTFYAATIVSVTWIDSCANLSRTGETILATAKDIARGGRKTVGIIVAAAVAIVAPVDPLANHTVPVVPNITGTLSGVWTSAGALSVGSTATIGNHTAINGITLMTVATVAWLTRAERRGTWSCGHAIGVRITTTID